jgi:hypothetical protein
LALLLIFAGFGSTAFAQRVVVADTLSTDDTRNFLDLNLHGRDSWYVRGFDSLFSDDDPQEGEAARGEPVRIAEEFRSFEGLKIRRIWILGREAFGTIVADSGAVGGVDPDDSVELEQNRTERILNSVVSTTRDAIIWNYILFEEGEEIDPFALADTERLLRQQRYTSDAKVEVFPLEDRPGWADVGVFVRDRWPIGVKAKVIDIDRYNFEVFHRNILGTGLNFEYEIPVRQGREPPIGHRVKFSFNNTAGSFVDLSVQNRNDWSKKEWEAGFNRGLAHPNLRVVGGFTFRHQTDRDRDELPEGVNLESATTDTWLGLNFRLREDDDFGKNRIRLVPAIRHEHTDFIRPPRQFSEEEEVWLDANRYLLQATLLGVDYYATSLVYSYGETEDIPAGVWVAPVAGYESSEIRDRYYHGIRLVWAQFTEEQRFRLFRAGYGGWRNDGYFEDGVLDFAVGGFSALREYGYGYWRHFYLLTYTLGINRTFPRGLRLDQAALRDLDAADIAGDQRLAADLESVLFTRYSFLGFKAATFTYLAGGFVGGENAAILDQRFSTNFGVGLRLNNPRMAIPTTELRFGLLSSAEGFEFSLYIRMKDVNPFRRELPSVVPSVLLYE